MSASNDHQISTIAIIGFGFAGMACLTHLVHHAVKPLKILIIDKSREPGAGVAYGACHPWHPLNVRAQDMGIFHHLPKDFYSWLEQHEPQWRALDPAFQTLPISSHAFLPRRLYAAYLQDVFRDCLERAHVKNIRCERILDDALDAHLLPEGKIELHLEGKRTLSVDSVVLALGTPPVKRFAFETPELLRHSCYVHDLWNPLPGSLLSDQPPPATRDTTLLIVGTGLTAIDAVMTLRERRYGGNIHLLSKHGRLPQVHTETPLPPLLCIRPDQLPTDNLSFLRFLRSETQKLQEEGRDWRQLIDALRPCLSTLWQKWTVREKRQFLRHLFPLWNRHRHRMSPESAAAITAFRENHQLKISKGLIENVVFQKGKLLASYHGVLSGKKETLTIDHMINCSGTDLDIEQRPHPLLQSLLKQKIVLQDSLGLGLKIAHDQELAGNGQGKIFTLGSLLFGERLETTAVPEIRQQADALAIRLTKG